MSVAPGLVTIVCDWSAAFLTFATGFTDNVPPAAHEPKFNTPVPSVLIHSPLAPTVVGNTKLRLLLVEPAEIVVVFEDPSLSIRPPD